MRGRHPTDCQVRRYMRLRTKNQPSVATAAAKAGFSTATGYRVESNLRLLSQETDRAVGGGATRWPASSQAGCVIRVVTQQIAIDKRCPA